MRWLVIAVFVLVVAGCETLEEPAPLPTRMQLLSETAAPANPSPSAPAIEPTALRPDEVRVLLPLEPIESTLAAGEVERWSFSAEAGDQVRIRSLSTAVSVGLTLLNPAGLSIATGVDALEITLGGGGAYLLETRAITGEGSYRAGADGRRPASRSPRQRSRFRRWWSASRHRRLLMQDSADS
ncbi:MAG: hypothetical protein HND48_08090 [Chloroflexi bacterium]|nr:hypothetical protein [Chloroflexota bacterium]